MTLIGKSGGLICHSFCKGFEMLRTCEKHGVEYVEQSGVMRCPKCCKERYLRYDLKNRKRRRKWHQSENGKASQLKYRMSNKKKNHHKNIARDKVSQAIKSGYLIRPDTCSQCGHSGEIEAHHYLGYYKEHWLDVQWLCLTCHRLI